MPSYTELRAHCEGLAGLCNERANDMLQRHGRLFNMEFVNSHLLVQSASKYLHMVYEILHSEDKVLELVDPDFRDTEHLLVPAKKPKTEHLLVPDKPKAEHLLMPAKPKAEHLLVNTSLAKPKAVWIMCSFVAAVIATAAVTAADPFLMPSEIPSPAGFDRFMMHTGPLPAGGSGPVAREPDEELDELLARRRAGHAGATPASSQVSSTSPPLRR